MQLRNGHYEEPAPPTINIQGKSSFTKVFDAEFQTFFLALLTSAGLTGAFVIRAKYKRSDQPEGAGKLQIHDANGNGVFLSYHGKNTNNTRIFAFLYIPYSYNPKEVRVRLLKAQTSLNGADEPQQERAAPPLDTSGDSTPGRAIVGDDLEQLMQRLCEIADENGIVEKSACSALITQLFGIRGRSLSPTYKSLVGEKHGHLIVLSYHRYKIGAAWLTKYAPSKMQAGAPFEESAITIGGGEATKLQALEAAAAEESAIIEQIELHTQKLGELRARLEACKGAAQKLEKHRELTAKAQALAQEAAALLD